jgi:hypothetical protein
MELVAILVWVSIALIRRPLPAAPLIVIFTPGLRRSLFKQEQNNTRAGEAFSSAGAGRS